MLLIMKLLAVLMLVVGGFFSKRKEPPVLAPWDLDFTLMKLSQQDALTNRHGCEGIGIFGGVGSCKTTGSAANIALSYLSVGQGGLVCCGKVGERKLWERYAEITGRNESLVVVSRDGKWRINFLEYALAVGFSTEQIVNLIMTVLETADREKGGDAKNDVFWTRALRQLLRNAIDVCVLAKGKLSVALLNKIILSAPHSHAEVHEEGWQKESFCYQCIEEADGKEKTPRQQSDFELAATYFLRELPDWPNETRGSVLATFSVFADSFLRGDVAEIFQTTTNFVPEVSFSGAVILLDFPIKEFGQAGLFVQAMFTHLWQLAAERRDVQKNPRFAFWFVDEAHLFVTNYWLEFTSTARSSRICSVLISQNLSNYFASLGGENGRHRVEGLLGNLNTLIFHRNGHVGTNEWASQLFAKNFQTRTNFSTSRGHHDSASGGGSQALESKVLPATFTCLAAGGAENQFLAECVIFGGGRQFVATGDSMLFSAFKQIL